MKVSDDPRLWDLLDQWEDLRAEGRDLSAEELCTSCPALLASVKDHMQALTAMAWLTRRDEDDLSFREPKQAGRSRQEGSPSMTPRALIEGLSQSGLLTAADVEALVRSHPPESSSLEELSRELVDSKKLTAYQVNLLCEGRWKGLVLAEYTILNQIGAGGMGQVFQAVHRRMDRIVALKVLPKETTASADAIRRFHHEVKAAAKLSHPNIVTAHDAGEQEGVHYLVMEYIEGTDLSRLVKENGPLPVDKAVDCILQAAKGLEYAHRRGIIHRDVKPANLLMNTEGVVKVLDMGLARIQLPADSGAAAEASEITRTGVVMGTADYMAPEQSLDAASVDRRADVYSLGCTLYFLLTGKPVYSGGNSMQRFLGHRESPIPSLRAARPEVTEARDGVFQRMVAKKPDDRFASMSAVIEALTNCPVQPAAPAAPAALIAAEAPKPDRAEAATQAFVEPQPAPRRPQRSSPTRSMGKRWLAAVAVAAVGLLGYLYVTGVALKVKTPGGTVWVEVDEPGAEVLVDGKQITITRPGDEPVKIELEEGKHELTVTKGGFKTSTKQFTLKAGGRATIRVRLVRDTVEPVKVGVKTHADPAFQRWMKQVAGMPAAKQVEAVAAKLKELNPGFDGKVTPEIEGGVVARLRFLTDNVTDVSPVQALKGLTSLIINGSAVGKGKLSDLSPLKGMNLTSLNCAFTNVSDLSPLKGMNLVGLWCYYTRVSDLSPLNGMKLTFLWFHGTKVSDLSALKEMQLTSLHCGGTQVSDLTPLKDMKLTYLGCWGTPVTDLSPLKGMPLKELWCDFKPFRDTEILRSFEKLEKINGKPAKAFWKEADARQAAFEAWCKRVTAMPAAKQVEAVAAKLKELNPGFDGKVTPKIDGGVVTGLVVPTDNVTDISPVRALPGLTSLSVPGSAPGKGKLSDLSPLKGMKLTWLACHYTRMTDLSPLADMKLTILYCPHTRVADLSPLKDMKLTQLDCCFTSVTDLTPLKGIPLTVLDCRGTRVSDLSALAGMKLKSLACFGTPVTDLTPLKGMPLAELWCDFKAIRNTEVLRSLKTLEKINEKPAKDFWKEVAARQAAFEAWCKQVVAMPAAKQVEAVAAKLKELNPGFDGKVTPTIADGVVTGLVVPTDNVTDISPVRALKGLKSLSLPGSAPGKGKLCDLTPLKGIQLTSLWCWSTQVSDLSPLMGMSLTLLDCGSTRVSDLTTLKGMKLTHLNCGHTSVTDLTPLKGMKLTHLNCGHTSVTDLSPLKGMKLTHLECRFTQASGLSPLKDMKLTFLDCRNTRVADLSPLKDMPLKELGCEVKPQRDNEILRSLATLEKINEKPAKDFWKEVDARQAAFEAWRKQVAALPAAKQVEAVAAKLKELNPGFDGKVTPQIAEGVVTELQFLSDKVTDLLPVRALTGLQVLHCSGTWPRKGILVDLSPLKGMNLMALHCNDTQVSDLSPLKDMKLTSLGCNGTQVSDLTPLKNMKLRSLNCGDTNVADLTPLKDMKLTYLYCYNTQVSDLSPLKGMPLMHLSCAGTKVADFSPLKGMPLKELLLDFKPFRDTGILRSLETLKKINEKPAKDFWKEVEAKKAKSNP
jgi:Leucine-rich repeat (LRR) protein